MTWKIPLFKTYWEEDDVRAIEKVIKRGTFWATGPEIQEFEKKISEFLDRKYGVAFNSGTSALHSVLLAYGIKGQEVIVPSFTFIATANAVILANGKPVFAEIEDESYGLDSENVKEKVTDKTKAIVPIHYGGAPCGDIKALREIAEDHNLLLIEDAAESLGSRIGDKMIGTFGDSAMFSFCQNKVITTGEGGVIVTNSEKIYQKLRLIRSHGRFEREEGDYFSTVGEMDYIQLGYNYRMPTMCAALGLSQFEKIDRIIKMRRDNAKYLNDNLSNIDSLRVPVVPKGHYHVYQMYTIQLESHSERDYLQKHLMENRIMTKVYFNPIHLMTFYKEKFKYNEGDLPKTEEISEKVLTLPMYPGLKVEELDYIINSIKEFFARS